MAHRKTRRIYDKYLTYENVYTAWNTVSHTCKNRQGVFEFAMFSHVRVNKILKNLRERSYYPNRFRCFVIFEPKPRLVMSQSIRDKIVNHFVTREYLMPILERTLVDVNVATRKKKGSACAMKTLKRYMSQMMRERPGATIYALKIDISKYFYSIDHTILYEKLQKKIKDKDVIELMRRITDETNKPYINRTIDWFNEHCKTKIPHYERGKGLSIGAMTSQFLAIFYLSDLDHYIKKKMKFKWYLRYMDDLVFLSFDKAELYRLKRLVAEELAKLKLKINPKSAVYNCCSLAGLPFLGYRYYIYNGGLNIKGLAKTARKARRRLKLLAANDAEKYLQSKASYDGYFANEIISG